MKASTSAAPASTRHDQAADTALAGVAIGDSALRVVEIVSEITT